MGGEEALAEIERILADGNGADRQRRVHAERGMPGLLADLAARTRAGARPAR
jgi:carboxylate-amine ligase